MKQFLLSLILFMSGFSYADTVIIFKDEVLKVPMDIESKLLGRNYEVKKPWASPMATLQNLPKDPWDNAKRQKNLAILIRGEDLYSNFSSKEIKLIEVNIPYSKSEQFFPALNESEENLSEPPFEPVKCDGIIYGFHHYSKVDQKLETAGSCDNYALRPNGDYTYQINISSPTPKTVEVYEHGSLVAVGSSTMKVRFTYGFRQKYMIVRGQPGPYHLEIYPEQANMKKEPLNSWVFSDEFSNAYGFGIPSASEVLGKKASLQSEWTGAHMMGVESLWEAGFTGRGIKVAIIDTGIASKHPFFKNTVIQGYEVFQNRTDPDAYRDVIGHGSHVAGIIHQVAPDAEIMAIRVFDENGPATSLGNISEGIRWAIDHGAHVINMSLGGSNAALDWNNLFKQGIAKGSIFVAAAGNERGFSPLLPAAYAGTIPGFGFSVGAADELKNMAVFSNWTGNNLNMKQLTGHGRRVLSVDAGSNGLINMSGTSMASPQIAGYLALLKSAYPKLSNEELIKLAKSHAERAAVND